MRPTKQGLRQLRRLRRLDVRLIATSSSLSGRGAPVRGKVRLVPRRRSRGAPGWYEGGSAFDPLPALKSWDAWS